MAGWAAAAAALSSALAFSWSVRIIWASDLMSAFWLFSPAMRALSISNMSPAAAMFANSWPLAGNGAAAARLPVASMPLSIARLSLTLVSAGSLLWPQAASATKAADTNICLIFMAFSPVVPRINEKGLRSVPGG